MSAQAAFKEEREAIRKKIEALLLTEQPRENPLAKPELSFEVSVPAAAVPEASPSASSAPDVSAPEFSAPTTSASASPVSLFAFSTAPATATPAPSYSASRNSSPATPAPIFATLRASASASSSLQFPTSTGTEAKSSLSAIPAMPATSKSTLKSLLFSPPSQVEVKRLNTAIASSRSKLQPVFDPNALSGDSLSYMQPKPSNSPFLTAPESSTQVEGSSESQPLASAYSPQPESNVSTFPSFHATEQPECDADTLAAPSFSMAFDAESEIVQVQEDLQLPPLGNADGDISRKSTMNNEVDLPRLFHDQVDPASSFGQANPPAESAFSVGITNAQPTAIEDSSMSVPPLLAGSPSTLPQTQEYAPLPQLSSLQFDLNLI